MTIRIFAVDCATKAAKVGLVEATSDGTSCVITRVHDVGSAALSMAEGVAPIIAMAAAAHASELVLLALDAPLGWPIGLAEGLHEHRAGQPLAGMVEDFDRYFRRETDVVVREHKVPLDVGADRIARTAVAALRLLEELEKLGIDAPLLWDPGLPTRHGSIEVYPAATLKLLGYTDTPYKKTPGDRAKVVEWLARSLEFDDAARESLCLNEHALDAALCVLTAHRFVCGSVDAPREEQRASAHREGWIWIPSPALDPKSSHFPHRSQK